MPCRAVQVVLYHGAKRGSITASEMAAADVVLTTYSTLENDYRRCVMPAKVACRCVGLLGWVGGWVFERWPAGVSGGHCQWRVVVVESGCVWWALPDEQP